jgi:Peptidase family M23
MFRIYNKVAAIVVIFSVVYCTPATAQLFPPKNYPKGYFSYPVGAPVGLSANFGELRPNHWHMGLDCKTNKRENLPIYAAAEGYIAKIKIEPYGFGRAIYINHPNGLTTLYAHLNDFYPELETWVKEQQYKRESWRVFLDSMPPGLFPVTRGQFIANSGNTGGSQGPHLHFEIRETISDKVLNPMLFGFNIPDAVPPKIIRLAVYDRCKSVYEQIPVMMGLKQKGNTYTTNNININTEKVSFAISATDAVSGNANPNGIYEAVIYDNNIPLCGFQLDSIGYNETRFLNAHIDYKLKINGGPYVQHISALPGYADGIYKNFNGDGVVNLNDGGVHHIRIVVKDANGNTAELVFDIRGTNNGLDTPGCNDSLQTDKGSMFFPRIINILDQPGIFFHTSEKTMYDSIRFKYARIKTTLPQYYSDIHQVHTPAVPVHDYFTINLKPDIAVPASLRDKLLIKRSYTGGKYDIFKGKWKGEWLSAAFRGFGNFAIVADTIPPVITPVGFKNDAVMTKAAGFSFIVRDNYEEITRFSAQLDGKWMLFSNDKGKVFKYKFDARCGVGPHELKVFAEDEAGNKTEKLYYFIR